MPHDAISAHDDRLGVGVGDPLRRNRIVTAECRGQGASDPADLLGVESGLGQQVLRSCRAHHVRIGRWIARSDETNSTLEFAESFQLLWIEAGRTNNRQFEPLSPDPVEEGGEIARWVEVVAELTGHQVVRYHSSQVFGCGGVPGEFPLHALEAVTDVPQGMTQRLCLLLGCGCLFTQARTIVGELPATGSEILGGL